jgi:hypothetical protein
VPTPLPDLAHRLLDLVVAGFDTAGVDLPETRYVAAGQPEQVAWDCEQVTVALAQVGAGLPLAPGQGAVPTPAHSGRQSLPTAELEVAIVRCAPTIDDQAETPDTGDADAAGSTALQDAWLLLRTIQAGIRQGQLTTDDPVASPVPSMAAVGPALPRGPDGGYAATVIRVSVQIMG